MSSKPPTVVMLAGLQGSGKTTAAGKLARHLVAEGRKPLLVAADLQRPAAVEQLRVLGRRIDVPVFSEPTDPVKVARGRAEGGRPHRAQRRDHRHRGPAPDRRRPHGRAAPRARRKVEPHDTLLVVDAMTGQEAVNVAEAFDEAVGLDGVILTKIDGDARGGAALSVKEVVGKPILFAGTGEKLDDFEPFHPDRMASRILGMGDVLTLIEKAEAAFDEEEAAKAEKKLRKGQFTLEDFLDQMQQVRKMGPIQNLVGMMPGLPEGGPRRRDRRVAARPDRGDHLLDDARGATQPGRHQRVAPPADRPGERHEHPGRQRDAEAVQDGPADDAVGGQGQDAAAPGARPLTG